MISENRARQIKAEMNRIEVQMKDLDNLTPNELVMLNARLDTLLLELMANIAIHDDRKHGHE